MLFLVQYEVMHSSDEGWKDVSEVIAMHKISECYDQVSPVLQDMFQGEEIHTPDAVFRVKK